jgi:hypothetical protein
VCGSAVTIAGITALAQAGQQECLPVRLAGRLKISAPARSSSMSCVGGRAVRLEVRVWVSVLSVVGAVASTTNGSRRAGHHFARVSADVVVPARCGLDTISRPWRARTADQRGERSNVPMIASGCPGSCDIYHRDGRTPRIRLSHTEDDYNRAC